MISLSGEVLAQQDIVLNRVLEFGCGTGAISSRSENVVVAGVSEGMLTVARWRIPEATFGCQDPCTPVP